MKRSNREETRHKGAIHIDVQLVPRASRDRIGPIVGERIKVQVTAPPVDGAANRAVCRLFAKALGIALGQVSIVRGETGRKKTLCIEGVSEAAVHALVDPP